MNELPEAHVRPRHRWSWMWLLPLFAAIGATSLLITSWNQRGILITLQFQQGHALRIDDAVRYRGIEIGKVHDVRLTDNLDAISVELRLQSSAREVARENSRFWIVRPQIDLTGASGLETVVGANYVSVLPGTGNYQTHFIGLDIPPFLETMEAGGVEITLTTPGRGNLRRGAPVTYRDVVIGTILDVDLAKDASAVEAKVYIKPNYASLVREDTRFWKTGGAKFNAGWLSGISWKVESVQNLIMGGITSALPPTPGKMVNSGQRFTLYEEPEPEWLQWTPHLAVNQLVTQANERPHSLLATLRWQPRGFWRWGEKQRQGWLLPVQSGLLGPADMLVPPTNAKAESSYLKTGELEILLGNQAKMYGNLAIFPYLHDYAPWTRQRPVLTPEDTLIVTDFNEEARFITADHYQAKEGYWLLDAILPIDSHWHGACAVAVSDGHLIGIVIVDGEQVKVVLLPEKW
ncbi:MAG: hypothetical protein BWK79_03035 [Beggiatoa sp. IS2]|nr:MAG: hypothetical protein BWK79_03035 [Beggiatoa sp. IS2]